MAWIKCVNSNGEEIYINFDHVLRVESVEEKGARLVFEDSQHRNVVLDESVSSLMARVLQQTANAAEQAHSDN